LADDSLTGDSTPAAMHALPAAGFAEACGERNTALATMRVYRTSQSGGAL
jgi:hypothetical protein